MAFEFKLPSLGENIEQAEIVKVLVSVGDKVEIDQILIELETDKATVEVPSEFSGIVKSINIKDGDIVDIGAVIMAFDEIVDEVNAKQNEVNEKTLVVEPIAEKPMIEKAIVHEVANIENLPKKEDVKKETMPSKLAPAAPTVRRFAREIGVDINEVLGSGPGGRISILDVKGFSKSINERIKSGKGITDAIKKVTLPDFSKWGNVSKEPMSNVRKKTAEHLSYAWTSIPHVTQFDKADITELEKLRKQYSKKTEASGGKLTVTAVLLKVVASALKVFPQFNASIDMDNNEIIYKDYFNIGIAVDTEKGLIVPVVKNVNQKNIQELATNLTEISEKARSKKITIEEMQGGCFTISNLGGIGGTSFTPIVNTPEVAILGVSRGSFEPVYKDGEFVPRMMLPLSLSYDHRIIDGADAIKFLRWIIGAIEQPFLLSLEG